MTRTPSGPPRRWLARLAWTAVAVVASQVAWFGCIATAMCSSHPGLASRKDWIVNTSIFVGGVALLLVSAGKALRAWRR